MPTDDSVDNVAAAASLQFFAYIYGAYRLISIFIVLTQFSFDNYIMGELVLTNSLLLLNYLIQTYDYACSFHEEWRFLLVSQWTKVKGLYIFTRYVPFLLLAINLYLSFIPKESPDKCRILDNFCSGFGILSIVCSEGFFALRTFALWNNNRILLAAMLSTFFIFVGASIGVVFTTTAPAAYATSAIPGITGCYMSSTSFRLFIPFLFLSVFELALMILTLIRAIQNWRIRSGSLVLSGKPIHNATPPLRVPRHIAGFVVLAILATRMHRHLWQIRHDSDALVRVPELETFPTESPP
ncbi:hypothetical protein BDR04DRAFT_1158147 [Suillus decipiens]|nr:hypothetical protein BDR04DRAFT_1158147 [Suillus decipiens]